MADYYKLKLTMQTHMYTKEYIEYFKTQSAMNEYKNEIIQRYEDKDSFEGHDEDVIHLTEEQAIEEITVKRYLELHPHLKEYLNGL